MIYNLIKVILIVGLFQGCWFYTTRGSLPAHISSISLAPVINESAEFAVAEILNEELEEMSLLAATLGFHIINVEIQRKSTINPKTYFGSGKINFVPFSLIFFSLIKISFLKCHGNTK